MCKTTLDDMIQRGIPESWECEDCGMDTAPGFMNAKQVLDAFVRGKDASMRPNKNCEVYQLKHALWKTVTNGHARAVLCIGCVEQRLGRKLRPKDFQDNALKLLPCTERLLARRMGMPTGAIWT